MKVNHLPFRGDFKVTWKFGVYSNITGTRDNKHHGLDSVGISNKQVYSTCVGKVVFAGFDPNGFGNYIKIKEDITGLDHYFAHLEKFLISNGQHVDYNTQIGIMGATGNVTGPHTHYEIRKNGTYIDPTPYMGIPNSEGYYNSNNFLFEFNELPLLGNYKVNVKEGVNVRFGPGTNYDKKSFNLLTENAKIQGGYKYGIIFTALEIKNSEDNTNRHWARTPSGWVCLDFCIKV
ncbi:MAG: M23 family metallopeptidase [Clostridia bacterium]